MEENDILEEEFVISDELQKNIDARIAKLREKYPKCRIYAIVIQGSEFDEKDLYVGYFREPSFKSFSKYLSFVSNGQQAPGMRALATECFLEGDRDLVDDDSLFLFGLMGQLAKVIEMRHGQLVNLSKARK